MKRRQAIIPSSVVAGWRPAAKREIRPLDPNLGKGFSSAESRRPFEEKRDTFRETLPHSAGSGTAEDSVGPKSNTCPWAGAGSGRRRGSGWRCGGQIGTDDLLDRVVVVIADEDIAAAVDRDAEGNAEPAAQREDRECMGWRGGQTETGEQQDREKPWGRIISPKMHRLWG
jgi:hypothetical protein